MLYLRAVSVFELCFIVGVLFHCVYVCVRERDYHDLSVISVFVLWRLIRKHHCVCMCACVCGCVSLRQNQFKVLSVMFLYLFCLYRYTYLAVCGVCCLVY